MGESAAEVFVGQSPRARQMMRLVQKIGQGRWPVLLLGETGTGKEVIARTIHGVSPTGPFVTIDCSSLVGPLMESELFGHTKGSFTGALNSKLGLIETAHGGTVFLDEIGEMPIDQQAKLLRVLQQKEFRPVGSTQQKKVDFRLISATNRDLAREVEKGTFRRDLFYRINVVTLRLAPLRERREDVPALVSYFLRRYGDQHEVSTDVLELLLDYPWPGNIRELENCIQRMVALASDRELTVAELPSPIQNFAAERPEAPSMREPILTMVGPPRMPDVPKQILPLFEVEKRAILDALEFTKGDRGLAASLLSIGRTTLYRKLREYQQQHDDRFRPFADPEQVELPLGTGTDDAGYER